MIIFQNTEEDYQYVQYLEEQVETNRRKINQMKPGHSWVKKTELKFIANRIKYYGLKRGICHGARTGAEVRTLRKLTGSYIIGTDISPTAKNYEFMLQADMNFTVKKAWLGYFDFIYSNSFDHAYDPAQTITAWREQLRPGGFLFLHWGKEHSRVNRINRIGGSNEKLLEFMNGRFFYHAKIDQFVDRPILIFIK